MNKKSLIIIAVFSLTFLTLVLSSANAQEKPIPIRRTGTFFYPWYGHYRHWKNGDHNPPSTWSSKYLPDLKPEEFDPSKELYDSSDKSVIKWQLKLMKKAGTRFAISSWWGKDSYEDQVFRKIMTDVMNDLGCPYRDLKWCIYYEMEGYSDPSVEKIVSDLKYVINNYGDLPYYYKINGKPVVFVYGWGENYADRWREVGEKLNVYTNLKVVSGYHDFSSYADSWHQYAPAMRYERQEKFSAFVSPGFWKWSSKEPRLQRDPEEFAKATEKLVKSNARFLLVETWNEWHEGTAVEPGQPIEDNNPPFDPADNSYENTYIKILGNHFRSLMPEPMDIKFVSPKGKATFENQKITIEVKVRDPYSDNVQAHLSSNAKDFRRMIYLGEDSKDYAHFKYTDKFGGGDHKIVAYAVDEHRYFSKNVKIGFSVVIPEFSVKNLSITKKEVEPGETTAVSVDVKNMGEAEGSKTVKLEIEGEVADKETVTLSPGESRTVEFPISKEKAGTHQIKIGELSKTLNVRKSEKAGKDLPWALIGGIIVVVIAISAFALYKRK